MKDGSVGKKFSAAGQSVLELVIALAIIVMSVSAGIAVFFGGQSLEVDTRLGNRAIYIARAILEEARNKAKTDFAGLTGFTATEDGYTKSLLVENIDAHTKRVTAKVSWQTDPQRSQEAKLVSIFTDWREAAPPSDPADGGGGGIAGNWRNPVTLGSVDLGPGNSATDLDVINKIVYMTAEASAASKPDFFIIDASDGRNPFIISELNTGPSLSSIDVSGNYAYVANREADAELQIIDVSDRYNPRLITTYAVPDVSGYSVGTAVFYSGGRVYLGLNKVVGAEFHIIDVSNPYHPVSLGSYEVGDDINDIYVKGSRAYLATDLNNAGLLVLDVSNPSAITSLGNKYSVDAHAVYAENPAVLLLGPAQDFYTVNASNPAAITTLGTLGVGDEANDIVARDYLAFIASANSNRELQVVNISSSTRPTLWSYFNFPQVATGVDYEDNLVYVAVRSNDALRIITSQ